MLNLLSDLQDEFRLAYLFISHDLSGGAPRRRRGHRDDLGRPIEHGARAEVFETPLHPYTRALQASSPSTDPPPSLQANRGQGRAALAAGAAARLRVPSPVARSPTNAAVSEVPKLQFDPGTTHLHACHAVEERRLPGLP